MKKKQSKKCAHLEAEKEINEELGIVCFAWDIVCKKCRKKIDIDISFAGIGFMSEIAPLIWGKK